VDASVAANARVRLRQAGLADAELLDAWHTAEYTGEFNDFGVPHGPVRPLIEANGMIGEGGGTLIVELATGLRPIGTISWRAVRYGPNPESLAWNIGINLVPEGRGRGYGAEAQRLLVEHLLATTRLNRVEAMTDVDNAAEQRSLEKAGFQREGVLRGAQFRAGRWHDLVVCSVTRPPAK